jgi:tellurite resistance protein
MDKVEIEASLKLLLALAQADGVVSGEERRLLSTLSRARGMTSVNPAELVDVDAELKKLKSTDGKEFAFRCAVAIANVDGKCTAPEHAFLSKLRQTLAPDAAVSFDIMQEREIALTRHARAEIDRATDAFLDQIATRGDSLPRAEYEKLLAELDAKKRAALASLTE